VAWLPAGSASAGDLRAGPVTAVTHWQLEIDAVRAAA
jgi:hypothetical protein